MSNQQSNLKKVIQSATLSIAQLQAGDILTDDATGVCKLVGQDATGAKREYSLGSLPGSDGAYVLWRPGAPTVPGQSYQTFDEAYNAALPALKTIRFDNTLAACEIPVGVWDFKGVMGLQTATELLNDDTYQIDFLDGAQILNMAFVRGGCRLNFNSSVLNPLAFDNAPHAGAPVGITLSDNAKLFTNNGAVAIVHVTDQQIPVGFRLLRGGAICANTFKIDANCFAITAFVQGSTWDPGYISGPLGSGTIIVTDDSVQQPTAGDIPAFLGNAQQIYISQAIRQGFVPAVPPDWSPIPQTSGDALDQLAARLTAALNLLNPPNFVLAGAVPIIAGQGVEQSPTNDGQVLISGTTPSNVRGAIIGVATGSVAPGNVVPMQSYGLCFVRLGAPASRGEQLMCDANGDFVSTSVMQVLGPSVIAALSHCVLLQSGNAGDLRLAQLFLNRPVPTQYL